MVGRSDPEIVENPEIAEITNCTRKSRLIRHNDSFN